MPVAIRHRPRSHILTGAPALLGVDHNHPICLRIPFNERCVARGGLPWRRGSWPLRRCSVNRRSPRSRGPLACPLRKGIGAGDIGSAAPLARMNTDCSIYRGTSGNGPTRASFGNHSTRRASSLARRLLIVGCGSSKANTAPTSQTSFGMQERAAAPSASRRAISDSVWFERITPLQWFRC